jgi:hypothetical protein
MPGRKWPEDDDAKLCRLWTMAFSLTEIAGALDRSERGVHTRAKRLRLPSGPPAGHEMLTAACERTGYHITQLRRILAWAKVRTQPVRAQPSHRVLSGGKYRSYAGRRFVAVDEMDAAITAWEERETATYAAERHQVSAGTIRRWLLDARAELGLSHKAVGHQRRARHWRASPALIDRVVAHRLACFRQRRCNLPPLPTEIAKETR